ncbi:hypothetical protein NYZ61_18025, partial [Acinetobacter baumannii]|nr:hypothetical protein [Acinetobacter baumannii]
IGCTVDFRGRLIHFEIILLNKLLMLGLCNKAASILKISTKFKFSSPLTPRSDKILDKVITYSQKLPYLPVFLDKINTTINHYIALLNILVKLI